jgi:hypothetical protein
MWCDGTKSLQPIFVPILRQKEKHNHSSYAIDRSSCPDSTGIGKIVVLIQRQADARRKVSLDYLVVVVVATANLCSHYYGSAGGLEQQTTNGDKTAV